MYEFLIRDIEHRQILNKNMAYCELKKKLLKLANLGNGIVTVAVMNTNKDYLPIVSGNSNNNQELKCTVNQIICQ